MLVVSTTLWRGQVEKDIVFVRKVLRIFFLWSWELNPATPEKHLTLDGRVLEMSRNVYIMRWRQEPAGKLERG